MKTVLYNLMVFVLFSLSVTIGVNANDISDRKHHSKTIQRELKKKKKSGKKKKNKSSPKSSKKNLDPCFQVSQEDALLALKAGVTNDPKNFLSNWVAGGSVCTGNTSNWKGIRCENGQVTGLKIVSKDVNGIVSPLIGCLSTLTNLDLGLNLFRGEIPTTLGNLTQLNALKLDGNDFSGTIPDIFSELPSLTTLLLYSNNLTGEIPSSLGMASSLTVLDLDNNNLVGTIPSSLGNLTMLSELYMGENLLNGSMPAEVCSLSSLTVLFTSCSVDCGCCTGCY